MGRITRAFCIIMLLKCVTSAINRDYSFIPSSNDKVIFLFELFDVAPRDTYLSYREVSLLQQLTFPQMPMTPAIWKRACRILGSNPMHGIGLEQFNSSYFQHAEQLGTNLDKDFNMIVEFIKHQQNEMRKNYRLKSTEHCRAF